MGLALAALPFRAAAQSLYAQSIQSALVRSAPGLEFLVLDLRSRETLAATFTDPRAPIPVGSLLKPFLALAYAQTHSGPAPAFVCHGHTDGCWKVKGHGGLALREAIAQSCNAYFLALAKAVDVARIPYLPPPPNALPETLIGLNVDWPIAPATLVNAYAELLGAPAGRAQAEVIAGMRASATHGTASRIGLHRVGILAKTGTAPCAGSGTSQPCRVNGDGLVVAAVPAGQPTLLLLVRRRGTTGAMAAEAAGRLLTQLEGLHAV